jgi:hypothetical protein
MPRAESAQRIFELHKIVDFYHSFAVGLELAKIVEGISLLPRFDGLLVV